MAANTPSSFFSLLKARLPFGLVGGALVLTPLALQAEIARVGQWALNADATVTTFSDSNPSLNSDKEATLGVTLEPNLRLQRVGTQLRTEAYLRVAPTYFTDDSVEDQTDVAAGFLFAFPYTDDRLPRSTFDGSYRDSTYASASLGRRVSVATYQFNGVHRFLSTGKLGAQIGVGGYKSKYDGDGLNENQEGRVSLAARFVKNPLTEYTLGVTQIWGESSPNRVGGADRKMTETDLAVGAVGKILPFVEAEAYAGVGFVRYRDESSRSDMLPIAGGSLTWLATARTSVKASLDARSDFSPDGNAQENYRLGLEGSLGLREGFRISVGGVIEKVDYISIVKYRTDDRYGTRAQLAYAPSQRFSLAVTTEYLTQYSDEEGSDFNRWYNTVSASYRF